MHRICKSDVYCKVDPLSEKNTDQRISFMHVTRCKRQLKPYNGINTATLITTFRLTPRFAPLTSARPMRNCTKERKITRCGMVRIAEGGKKMGYLK